MEGYLHCFYFGAIMNDVSKNVLVPIFWCVCVCISFGHEFLKVKLLSQRVRICWVLGDTTQKFSKLIA